MAGGHYTCAILTTEGTVCWGHGSQHRHGRNTTGNFITMGEELGNGTGSPYDTIAKSHRSSLSPNSPHTCIVDEMSEVQCWGATHVVPGSGGPAPQTVNVGGLVRSVVVSDASACALRIDGNLICWESNSNGQLGHGGTTHNYANSDGEIMIQTLMFDCGPQIQILMEQSTFGTMMMMMMVYWILTMISVSMNVHHWIQTMMVCQIQLSHHVPLFLLRI